MEKMSVPCREGDGKWQNALLVKDGIEAMMKSTIAQVVGRNLIGRNRRLEK